jgi:CRP/FNR family transcriptional regulator, dissimilatory nitrate respiration regulator
MLLSSCAFANDKYQVSKMHPALACLRRAPLFDAVSDAALLPLAESGRMLRFAAGQEVFAHGCQAQSFFAVQTGEVHLYRPAWQGEEKLFQILNAGDLLAESAMFLQPPSYPLSARAHQESSLFTYTRSALLELCDAAPQLMKTLLFHQSHRLYQAVNRIDHLLHNNAGQRLVLYLLELRRDRGGHWLDMPSNIDLPVNIAALAGQLTMTPETLSRLLQRFRQENWISGKGRTLILIDLAALCQHVGLPAPSEHHIGAATPAMVGCCNL